MCGERSFAIPVLQLIVHLSLGYAQTEAVNADFQIDQFSHIHRVAQVCLFSPSRKRTKTLIVIVNA